MSLNLEPFKNRIFDKYTIEAKDGIFFDFPEELHKDLKSYLIWGPAPREAFYSHKK